MCLYSKTDKAKRAIENIVCYKIVIKIDGDKCYKTPYFHAVINDNIINGKEDFKASGKKNIKENSLDFCVEGGFVHTFDNLEKAFIIKSFLKKYHAAFGCSALEYSIFRCIIPKGTFYFEGYDSDYASRKIRFVEMVN